MSAGWPEYMARQLIVEGHRRLDSAARAQTVALIRTQRATGTAKPRRRLPKQVYPKLIEKEYALAILAVVRVSHRILREEFLNRLPPLLQAAWNERADADEGRKARNLADAARDRMRKTIRVEDLDNLATTFADRTSTHNKEQLRRQVRAQLGVDPRSIAQVGPMLGHFTAENVSLIRTIPERLFDEVDKIVTRGITEGSLYTDLAEEIQNRFDISENQAKLIARDQIGKLNGQLNAARQQSLGVTRFTWRSSGDDRVREEHADLDGEEFSYDDPPSEGLPGEAILCRCSAEPIFEDILEEI